MVFQGLTRRQAVDAWRPFFAALDASPKDFDLEFSPLRIVSTDARTFWAPTLFKRSFGFIKRDGRPGAPETNVFQGLAGAPAEAIAATRDTAMNPAVFDAFAHAILGARGDPAYPGVRGHEPDAQLAAQQAAAIDRATAELRKVAPEGGAYVSESSYFQRDWERAFWGSNAGRLRAVKAALDPHGVFFTHHGPASEGRTTDRFSR